MERKGFNRPASEWLPYLLSAALVCLLILTLTAVAIWQESLRFRDRAETIAQNSAIALAEHTIDVFEKGDALLRQIAYQYKDRQSYGEFDPKRFHAYLTDALSSNKDFSDIRLLDAQGVLRFGTGEIAPIDLADRDYFTRLRDQQATPGRDPLIFSGPIFTRLSKKWVLVLARRLENPDGSFGGIVYANLKVDDFTTLFSRINTGKYGTIVLRTDDMRQVSRYPTIEGDEGGVGNRKVSQLLIELIKKSPSGGSYHATSPLDNTDRYYTYRKVNDYPFYIIAGQATGELLSSLGLNFYLLLAFSGLMILITIVGAWRLYMLNQQRLRERINQTAEEILKASPVAMLLFNDRGVVTNANPATFKQLGYAEEELIGVTVDRLLAARSVDEHARQVASAKKEVTTSSEGLYERKDGSQFPALRAVAALPIELGNVGNYLETVVDITELKEAQESLRRLAHYDTLTNLPNRGLFFDLVGQALAQARRDKSQLAILFLDLDKFKPINDTWGHAVGDLVLKEAAQRISACLREVDTVGRVGGDEFLVLLRDIKSVLDVFRVAEKIRESLSQPIVAEGKALEISSCIGAAVYPEHGLTADELTKNADTAMYHAKETGRNRVVIYSPQFPQRLR